MQTYSITAPSITAPHRTAGPTTTTIEVARRTVRKFVRSPQLAVVGTIQGAMFLLIFRYVFGGAIDTGGIPYVDFLVPGFVLTSVLFSGSSAASGVAEDLEAGFIDRLRSLPIPRTSVMAGRALADTITGTWGLAITTAIGFLVGFRLHASALDGLAAFGLCIVAAYAFSWVFIYIGLMAGTAQAAQGISLLVFPFTFVSSAFVPVSSMPGWMQPFAEHQPITVMVNAVRSLVLGSGAAQHLPHPTGYYVVGTLLWGAAISAVFGVLSVLRYRKG
ncbi:MAG TPA: ABC transporter permease [Acidimicrobiia bacterium]|nr:ABC transporter permease [Acidimicrobiia bacterium]